MRVARLRLSGAALTAAAIALALPAQAASGDRDTPSDGEVWRQLRDSDLTLASTLYRLANSNVSLCTDIIPETGLVLISPDEFPAQWRSDFHKAYGPTGAIAVEAIVPDSPAAHAKVLAGSGIDAINAANLPPPRTASPPSTASQIFVRHALEQAGPNQPIALALREGNRVVNRTLNPRPGCRAYADLLTDDAMTIQSDDTTISISATFIAHFSGDALPVLIAHELAHIIRHHGQKLDSLHVHRGWLSEIGHDANVIRSTEDEADRLSVHLLANAGYDPQTAVTFWKTEGRRIYPPLMHSPTHASPAERANLMQAEITRMACHPGGCDRGDAPFTGTAP